MKYLKRRDFLKNSLLAGSAVMLGNSLKASEVFYNPSRSYAAPEPGEMPDIVSVSVSNIEKDLVKLLEPLGGIKSFVKPGQSVGLLANSPWKNRGYHTNPDLVIAVANLCLSARAKEIICLKPADQNYWQLGDLFEANKSVTEALKFGTERIEVSIPKGVSMKKGLIFKDFMEVDVFINIPVAKHHVGCLYSGNLKGLMGVTSSETNRYMHSPDGRYTYDEDIYLSQCIADLNLVRKPDLCIIDALECGINNGPAGPGETVAPNKLIAGTDPLATDVYAAKLLGFYADDIMTFHKAAEHGIGEIDPGKVKLMEL